MINIRYSEKLSEETDFFSSKLGFFHNSDKWHMSPRPDTSGQAGFKTGAKDDPISRPSGWATQPLRIHTFARPLHPLPPILVFYHESTPTVPHSLQPGRCGFHRHTIGAVTNSTYQTFYSAVEHKKRSNPSARKRYFPSLRFDLIYTDTKWLIQPRASLTKVRPYSCPKIFG